MSIAGSKIVDKNAILVRDEAVQRQIAINLQKKFEPISKALFREKQAETYLNTLMVSNEPTVANLIANARDSVLQNDELQSYSLARNNLLSIADQDTTDYILDRLEDRDISTLNQRFPAFIKILTTKYKNIDKNKFIELIKNESFDVPELTVTERGQNRLDSLEYSLVDEKKIKQRCRSEKKISRKQRQTVKRGARTS